MHQGLTAVAALVLGLAGLLPACAATPASTEPRSEIGGRVVDAVTGTPVEGAVVIATWWTELPPNPAELILGLAGIGGHGAAERCTAYVSESLTDRDGRFVIPGWSVANQWQPGRLTSYSPSIRFVARGYAPAAAGLGSWSSGQASDIFPGIGGPGLMKLFRPGQVPKPDLGRSVSGLAIPTLEEETYNRLRDLQANLEADAMAADSLNAPVDSAARKRARSAQLRARRLVDEELRSAYAAYKKATP